MPLQAAHLSYQVMEGTSQKLQSLLSAAWQQPMVWVRSGSARMVSCPLRPYLLSSETDTVERHMEGSSSLLVTILEGLIRTLGSSKYLLPVTCFLHDRMHHGWKDEVDVRHCALTACKYMCELWPCCIPLSWHTAKGVYSQLSVLQHNQCRHHLFGDRSRCEQWTPPVTTPKTCRMPCGHTSC